VRPRSTDSGFTLVEVLVAVVILGIAAAGIIPAVRALILSSQDHRGQASADAVLRSYSEAVEEKVRDLFVLCPTLAQVTPTAAEFSASGWSLAIAPVSTSSSPVAADYWIPSTADFRTGTWGNKTACTTAAATKCPTLSPTPPECDGGLMRVRVTVTSTTTNPSRSTPQASTELLVRRGQA